MARHHTLVAALLLAVAPGVPFPKAARRPQDPRASILGIWAVSLRVDARRYPSSRPLHKSATGRVTFADSIGADSLRGQADIDFTPIGGAPCFWRPDSPYLVQFRGDSVHILLTPYASDCGLAFEAQIHADSLIGRWVEPSVVGNAAEGRLVMTRLR
jgi:hypothetical protein